MPELTRADLRLGATYRAKRPRRVGIYHQINDRTIIWIGTRTLQYDGPSVRMGAHYPSVTFDEFLKWASHIIPEESGT